MARPLRLRKLIARCALAVVATGGLLGLAPPAHAQAARSDDEAAVKELVRKGFAALKKNDLEASREAFAGAWAKRQHFAIALSLAEVEMKLGRYVEAAEHWQYVLKTLPDDLADKRAQASEQLAACKKHVGTLTLRVNPNGASLYVDGQRAAEAPLQREVYLKPGEHDIYAEKDGRRSPVRAVRLSAGASLSLELVIPSDSPAPTAAAVSPGLESSTAAPPPSAEPAPPLPSSPPEQKDGSSLRVPVLVSGVVLAVAGATVGSIFVVKSNGASDDARAALNRASVDSAPGVDPRSVCGVPDRPSACDDADQSLRDKYDFRKVAIGSFIAAGAVAVVSTAAFVLWPESKAAAQVSPSVGPGFAGLVASGRF